MVQICPSVTALCGPGLPKLLQTQLAISSAVQQACSFIIRGCSCAVHQQQQHTSYHSSTSSGTASSSSNAKKMNARRAAAHRARLPRVRKYGPELRDKDPAAFERMRLVVGYYDLPENRNKPKPPAPSHVTINNMQTLRFTDDVDPYYKLALLSYRSKLENVEIVKGLAKTRRFLQQLSAPPEFVPANLEALAAAPPAAAAEQQQQHDNKPTE